MDTLAMPWMWLLLGLLLSGIIGGVAYWHKSLSPGGVAGAIAIGTLTFGLGGWAWGLLLVAFFVSSSLLSHFRADQKRHLAEKFSKGGRRDLVQTFANGGIGALLAVGYFLWPAPWLYAAFVGLIAAVNADTWATELGVFSPGQPRILTTWEPAPIGTSGAVSLRGTLASLAGGLFIGGCAWLFGLIGGWTGEPATFSLWELAAIAGVGGLGGALFDSLLGATFQAIYYCDTCDKETEQTRHHCRNATRQIRGWRWLDNDLVNLISSIVGGILAVGIIHSFR